MWKGNVVGEVCFCFWEVKSIILLLNFFEEVNNIDSFDEAEEETIAIGNESCQQIQRFAYIDILKIQFIVFMLNE